MKGARASLARRRAISVLPTPVGPIMRMFLGVISWRSGSPTCMRRQRLRSAIATDRFAAAWPTMCLSSSWTISRGVMVSMSPRLELVDDEIAVGVDADVGGDAERALDDLARGELRVGRERARRREREGSARADGHDRFLWLDHVAVAGDDEGGLLIRDAEERLEPPECAVGAPVLGELDRRTREVAVLLELALEALKEREGVGRAAREARENLVAVEPANLAGVALHDGVADRHLAVAAHRDEAAAAHREYRGAVRIEWGIAHRISYLRLFARGWDSS